MNTDLTISKKIIIIGPAYPLRGGLASFDELFCQALTAQGHEASIISYSLQYPSFLFPGTTQYHTTGAAPKGVTIHTLINSVNPLSWLKTARFINAQQPHLIIIRYWIPFMGPALGSICRMLNKSINVMAITDNVLPHEPRVGDKLFTRYFVNGCKAFVTMSEAVMHDLLKFTNTPHRKRLLHPLYTDFGEPIPQHEARAKLGIGADDKVVLFFGLIRHYKGLDMLLEAMADERIKTQNIKLIVAGEYYEDEAPYNALIKASNNSSNILLHTRFIPNDEVKVFFSATNLVALPYRNATQSGVTQVSFHYETPTIVTNVGGLAEIIPDGKCGYVCAPNATAIADAIVNYFTLNKQAEFTQGMKEEKKKYEWEVFVSEIIKLHNQSIQQC